VRSAKVRVDKSTPHRQLGRPDPYGDPGNGKRGWRRAGGESSRANHDVPTGLNRRQRNTGLPAPSIQGHIAERLEIGAERRQLGVDLHQRDPDARVEGNGPNCRMSVGSGRRNIGQVGRLRDGESAAW
jgi:hypothetical protein